MSNRDILRMSIGHETPDKHETGAKWETPTRSEEDEGSRGGGKSAWIVSLAVHGSLLALLALVTLPLPKEGIALLLATNHPRNEELPLEQFHFSEVPQQEIGSSGPIEPEAPRESDEPEIPDAKITSDVARIEVVPWESITKAQQTNQHVVVRGAAGVGVTGAMGAVDRITHEIVLSLEQRPTLVIWIFDQSLSLQRQREVLIERFNRIYEELSVIEASGDPAFARHKDKPLLTSVMAFGEKFSYMTPKPTDDVAEIEAAVEAIEIDPLGQEHVATAVYHAARKFRKYRVESPERNLMIVLFTDEAGNDLENLDQAVLACQKFAIPVYIVGVPAPFGRRQVQVKYVDPDPNWDQAPQWPTLDLGPESLMPERIQLHFSDSGQQDEPIDSGFGPFGLTRLCVETGGIYFAVHPNRNTRRKVTKRQTAELASYLTTFFDPAVMRAYRPDYVSAKQYERLLRKNRARAALVEAASFSWVTPMDSVRRIFPKSSEGALANLLSQAQQSAAILEPKIKRIHNVLLQGIADRPKLSRPRWRAGFDLAYGRTLAVKVRTESYNVMLAKAKQSMKFKDPKSDTWILKSANTVSVGGTLQKQAEEAEKFLNRVVQEHPNTPWALLANRELKEPFGWQWTERYTGVAKPRFSTGSGRSMPQDDRLRRLNKPKPKRKPPAL